MSTNKLPIKNGLLTSNDKHLLGEGKHYRLYDVVGAHPRTVAGEPGVNFSVWAPNAKSVSVVGDFNNWEPEVNCLVKDDSVGYWEGFIKGLSAGQLYKYSILGADGSRKQKIDPCGFSFEMPPRTAAIVADLNDYEWRDKAWIESRTQTDVLNSPISIFELHLGSWLANPNSETGWFDYRTLAKQVVEYCKQLNFTHIQLLPISEHPFTGSWGYQTLGYFAPTARYGSPQDFMWFVDYCHQNEIGVIVDWVPAHFPKDEHGLARFDGTALFEHADPQQGEHPDWGTLIFNYGRTEVQNFLISNALFWLDKYHIDGLRVDAVASMLYLDYSREEGDWIPNKYGGRENLEAIDFLKRFNEVVHGEYPGILTIAEESTAWGGVSRPTYEGGLGFSMKWNMGWMNDTLKFMRYNPVHRKFHHDELTFSLIYAFSENFMLPFSHDEVVHGKGSLLDQMPGDLWQKFANLRLLYTYMWTHPGKQLMFMGCEFGQWNEWNHDGELQWDLLQWETHQGLQKLVGDLNQLQQNQPALYERDFDQEGFEWISCQDHESSVIAFVRRAADPEDWLIVAFNFTPIPRPNFLIGAPQAGSYQEIFNSDSEFYDGSNFGNGGENLTVDIPFNQFAQSLKINLPPLGAVIMKPDGDRK